jgi:hypothetical protein
MNRFSRGIILLGHSNIAITLRTYAHLLPSMQQEVVDTWDGVFQKEEKSSEENDDESGGLLAKR